MTDVLAEVSASSTALVAFVLFVPIVVSFRFAPGVRWAEYLGIFFHLAIFALVAKLPAPGWSQSAGYGWLFLDVTAGVMILNRVSNGIADYIRLGGHIFGGIWIASASLAQAPVVEAVGIAAGAWLVFYSLVATRFPRYFLAPASLLTLIWLLLLAFFSSR